MAWGRPHGIMQGVQLANRFASIGKEIEYEVEKGLDIAALLIQDDAKKRAPVDTGRLRSSIAHRIVKPGPGVSHAEIGTNLYYAPYQEYGVPGGTPAQPFLFPALYFNRKKVQGIIRNAVMKGMKAR